MGFPINSRMDGSALPFLKARHPLRRHQRRARPFERFDPSARLCLGNLLGNLDNSDFFIPTSAEM
jgi:hypothetical protein